MRFRGKNYRPALWTGRRSAQPQTYNIGAKKVTLVDTIMMGSGKAPTPPAETFYILTEGSDVLNTEGGDRMTIETT